MNDERRYIVMLIAVDLAVALIVSYAAHRLMFGARWTALSVAHALNIGFFAAAAANIPFAIVNVARFLRLRGRVRKGRSA